MPKTDISLTSESGTVGRITFDTQNIYATGGPDFPKLGLNLELRLSPVRKYVQGQSHQQAHPLTWLDLSGQLHSPEDRAIAEFHQTLNHYADGSYAFETQCQLGIPLDLLTVERMEQSRESDLRVALQFEGLFAIHLPGDQGAVLRFETARIERLAFIIPKSKWVEQLLPQLGYGRLELIEVRISNGTLPTGIPKAVQEIRQARDYLTNADWEKSVVHCRKTLETILESKALQVPPTGKFSQKVDTFIADHLPSLDREKSALLAEGMKQLWAVCSKSAHPNVSDYFTRADAQFILRSTTAVLEYISRLIT